MLQGYGLLLFVVLPATLFMFFMGFMLIAMWARIHVRDKIMVRYWDTNRVENSALIKLAPGELTWILGKADDPNSKKFSVDITKQHFSTWPGGLPSWMQVTVPTYYYRLDQCEPLDPRGEKLARVISPRLLNQLSSEAVILAIVRMAREAAEGSLAGVSTPRFIMIGVSLLVLASTVMGFFLFQQTKKMDEILVILGAAP